MSVFEGLVLDGLNLNSGSGGTWILQSLEMPPPAKRLEWTTGSDADGAGLIRDPFVDNREITARLRLRAQASMDAALPFLAALTQKLEETEQSTDGLPLVWTPNSSTKSCTFYVLTGSIAEMPLAVSGDDAGWLLTLPAPVVTVHMICKPFGYLPALANTSDNFTTNTLGNYTFDVGTNTLTVTGGQLVPSSTTEKRIIHTASTYPVTNAWTTVKITTGANVSSGVAGAIGKRLDATNFVAAQATFAGTSTVLQIVKLDGGAPATLASSATISAGTSTSYWFRCRFEGNTVIAEMWDHLPDPGGIGPLRSVTFTLTGPDATKFGKGVSGRAGIRLQPQATDWRADDFLIEPNSSRTGGWSTGTPGLPVAEMEVYDVPGDVPAEGRLILTDGFGADRRTVEWGLEQRYYDPANPTPLILDADSVLDATGYGGDPGTVTGAYDPDGTGTNVITQIVRPANIIALTTGVQQHIGQYRVKARVQFTQPTSRIRFVYGAVDGVKISNPWASAWISDKVYSSFFNPLFSEIDLGVINIDPAIVGSNGWEGFIETAGEAFTTPPRVHIDALYLVPVSGGYGRGRGAVTFESISNFATIDSFDQTAGLLGTKIPPTGGSWQTTGTATTDFSINTSSHVAERTAVSDPGTSWAAGRMATVFGPTFFSTLAQVDFLTTTSPSSGGGPLQGLLIRYVSATQAVIIGHGMNGNNISFLINSGAGWQTFGFPGLTLAASTWYTIRAVALRNGIVYVWEYLRGTTPTEPMFVMYHPALDQSLAGALSSGLAGIYDYYPNPSAVTRQYDNFLSGSPTTNEVIVSGRSLEVRPEGAFRQSAIRSDFSGTSYSPPPLYRGAGFMLPPSGDKDRVSRVAYKASRNDLDMEPNSNIGDQLQAQVLYTPRVLTVPR